ncbi:MAG TPA: RloB domain-containing protein [Methanosarcinaceae archaeon]|nr:RloB domain-containing protein [Methanosarcinaceae archaeon]
MVRKEGTRSISKIWIFCEGEKTEIHYFKHLRSDLRIQKLQIKVNSSNNKNALGVVNYALKFLERKRDYVSGDIIACVFDRDQNSSEELESAKKLASHKGIDIIFSNPCFEFWILSHFECYKRPLDKDMLKRRLISSLGQYSKNDPLLYKKTKEHINDAIKFSKDIISMHEKNGIEIISRDSNPSTLVHKLIEQIHNFDE